MRFDILLERLSKHHRLKSMVEGTSNLPADELIETLLNEFEQIVERYRSLSNFAGLARQLTNGSLHSASPISLGQQAPFDSSSKKASRASKKRPEDSGGGPSLQAEPIKIELPTIDLKRAERTVVAKRVDELRKQHLRKELETVERTIHAEIQEDWDNKAEEIRERIVQLKSSQQLLRNQLERIDSESEEQEDLETPEVLPPHNMWTTITNDDVLYLHAAAFSQAIEGGVESHCVADMMGIDGRNPVFTVDLGGLSFFVSKIQGDNLTVTKSGLLLLNNHESLKLRCAHEEIVNTLRLQHMLLSFEFGSIIRGKEEFELKANDAIRRFRSALNTEEQTRVWTVKLFALDIRVGEIVSREMPVTSVQERGRESKKPSKRFNIKLLERMLQHERNVAEAVHDALASHAVSHDILSIVNIGNGRSEDWKLILHSSYEIVVGNRSEFFSAVLERQEQYGKMGMMVEVYGTSGRFSFCKE